MRFLRRSDGESRIFRRGAVRILALGFAAAVITSCGTTGSKGGESGDERSEPPAPPAVKITPSPGAEDVSPIGDITARATNARLTEVVMINASDEKVNGAIASDGASWSAGEPLGYGKRYTIVATAKADNGRTLVERSQFTTFEPQHQTYVSMNPVDGETVGVGQPLAFYFSEDAPAPNKRRAERAIEISTEPRVTGAFYWFDDREVHWRPKEYWNPGTKITVNVNVYGKDLGNGVYGRTDRKATITIGDKVVVHADGASHQMSVEVNGKVVRTLPISMGRPSFPTHNGVHVVMRKSPSYLMDSTTYGLGLDEGGYKTRVKWAVRISNGGEFLHAAPWSVGDQGERNVSHGCINLSTANAKWAYDLLKKGDIVRITNSGGEQLASWDGFGDWQVPWSEWVNGNT